RSVTRLRSFMTRFASSFCFQAEDGIRDRNVTGVQTCALPISCPVVPSDTAGIAPTSVAVGFATGTASPAELKPTSWSSVPLKVRSEERRVGKECRARGRQADGKKKKQDGREVGEGELERSSEA